MKNKLILILTMILASNTCVFAIQDSTVISDSAKIKSSKDQFDGLTNYTDNFFTPHVVKKEVVDDKSNSGLFYANAYVPAGPGMGSKHRGTILPIPKFKRYLRNMSKPKEAQVAEEDIQVKDQGILDCDFMEYFADRTELEANGHVIMTFPQNDSTIKADKMVYNQTTNFVKAYGNVVLINGGKEMCGDYMQIDMNEENALLDNPTTDLFQIRARAKKGYMYGDKLIQEQGSMYIKKRTPIYIRNEFAGPDLDAMYLPESERHYYAKDSHGEKFKIKTDDIIINSKKEHDTLTLKHAEIYFDGKKVGTVPTITVHTNKNQDYAEANYPEMGSMTNFGMYAGPGFVFDTPMGTNLKVIPVVNYRSNSMANDNELGFGAIAKFKSATNQFYSAYGTANKTFILRGKQRLDDNIYLQYGSNSYMDDWFMGFRMPRLMGEVVYEDTYPNKDFFGKGLGMAFSHRIAGAYVQDGQTGRDAPPFGEDGVGTMRFKYMAQVSQTLWTYGKPMETPINAALSLIGQGSAAMYGTGDTQLVTRVGPMLHTQYKNWMQDVGYFLSAYSDNTPLVNFDRYMYGRSNAYVRETFRVHKYVALSWFGSFNLLQDSWDGKMLQENAFFISLGPDDVKLHIGYDTIREQSFVTMAMNIDAKGASVDYKKMVIKNPDTLGKDKKGNSENQAFEPTNDDDSGIERAEVTDIKEAL